MYRPDPASAPLRLRLLGDASTRPDDLVTLLALAEDHRLPRDEVAALLPGPAGPGQAGTAVRVEAAVEAARRRFGPSHVDADGEAVMLRGVAVDLDEIEAAALVGEPTALDTVLGFGPAPLDLAGPAARELLHRRMMRLYLALGWPRRAARQYRDCVEALRGEPGPATVRLHERALAATPPAWAHDAHPPRLPPPLLRRPAAPLVGRAELLAALGRDGEAALTLVTGEMGVGKTRLVTEAARRAAQRGAVVLWGSAVEGEGTSPYGMLTDALEGYAAGCVPHVAAALAAEYPALARQLRALGRPGSRRPSGPEQASPEQRRARLFADVADLLCDLAAAHPVVVVLDDLHDADEGSLRLLRHLVRRAAGSGLRFVATLRDSDPFTPEVARFLDTAGREPTASRIDLSRLARAECDRLVAALLRRDPPADLLDRIFELSLGNPLFASELAASGLAGGTGVARDTEPLPRRLDEHVAERMDRLPAPARRLLDLLAAAGAGSPLRELCDAAAALDPPLAPAEVAAALEEARAARLVERRDVRGAAGYAFTHPLPRLAVYQRLPSARRVRLHEILGEVVERHRPDDVDALALHFGRACGQRDTHYLERAGDRARELYANAAAAGYYEQLVRRCEQRGDPAGATRGRVKWGMALRLLGRHGEALAVLEEAMGHARRAGDHDGVLDAATHIGHVHAVTGRPHDGLALIEPLAGQGSPAVRARAQMAITRLCFRAGRYADQCAAADRVVRIGAELGGPQGDRVVAEGLTGRAVGLVFTGRQSEARQYLEAALPLAERCGDAEVLTKVLGNLSEVYAAAGELRNALAYRHRTLALAERTGEPDSAVFERANVARLRLLTGRWDEAFAAARVALAGARSVGRSWSLPYALVGIGEIYLRLGWTADAGRSAAECLMVAGRGGDAQALRHGAVLRAEVAIATGHPDEAVRVLDSPTPDISPYADRSSAVLARAHLERGDLARAQRLARRCAQRSSAVGDRLVEAEGRWVLGLALARAGSGAAAEAVLREALAAAEAMPHPYLAALVLAALTEAGGDPEPAARSAELLDGLRARVGAVTAW